ncbi:SMP-30/gluconolactonase/LRE family protein [Isoalcanivorax indicus]|uniref:SMP-30/gluconolactonase/LRE family protein n=1 Tax=Isoalcanivorax indicus TaxID=2202653 RepID=UPI000DBA2F06|nr:SMP-30/gluconolactonase/LRE family protein [Isoalcanivorax indicus]
MKSYPNPVPAGDMKLLRLPGLNPEDVILDKKGRIYCGLEDGSILRMNADGSDTHVVANTSGRPLGLDWLPDGRLLVCDCLRGLLAVDTGNGSVELLLDSVDGKKMMICNNPAVAKDGTIYFTDSSTRYLLTEIRRDIIEHIATGRLLRRNTDGSVDVLLDHLQFANGVVLAEDESFVLVAETGANRINRVWLKGSKKGASEIFADNLPGMPDNMSWGSDGLFWVALPSAVDKRLQLLHRLPTVIRKLIARIPEKLQPADQRSVLFMAFNAAGECVHFIEGNPLRFHLVTGVREKHGKIYAGSIEENAVAVIDLPSAVPR